MMTFKSEKARRIVAAVIGRTAPQDQKPLTGRIKHLGRQGFPAGTSVGHGRSIAHHARALSHLVIAMVLIDRHMVAGAAIACIDTHGDVVDRFVRGAMAERDDGPGPPGSLVIAAGALASLGRREVQATSVTLSSNCPGGLDGIVVDAARFGSALQAALIAEGVTVPDFLDALTAADEARRMCT